MWIKGGTSLRGTQSPYLNATCLGEDDDDGLKWIVQINDTTRIIVIVTNTKTEFRSNEMVMVMYDVTKPKTYEWARSVIAYLNPSTHSLLIENKIDLGIHPSIPIDGSSVPKTKTRSIKGGLRPP
jgi:hypothetical protein